MQFVLIAHYKSDFEKGRPALLQSFAEHQRFAAVRFGGTLYNDQGGAAGELLIIEATSLQDADAFARASPYRQGGLYDSVEIRELRTQVGGLTAIKDPA